MEQQTKDLIKNTITQLIEKIGFEGQIEINDTNEEDGIVCNIATQHDSHFLIGQHGVNLQALQHLARLMVRKQIPEKIRFTLDVNDYRLQKNQSVVEQAIAAAEEAIREHRAVSMKPMTTYERRIAHLELSQNTKVSTESVGEGDERKIVVKPAGLVD